ncbi:MAG: flagellar basal body-associated FliL family protein [Micavibrio sp.]
MKPILLALVAIILLGGGGAGAYFYFKQPAEAATGASGEAVKAEKAKKHDEHASSFVQLDPLILPVVGKDGLTQLVSLVIVIETPDEAGKQHITYMSPRLKDAYIQDMYGALNQEDVMRGGIIEVTALKNRLHKVSERVMGAGVVDNVLLQVVQQRPM